MYGTDDRGTIRSTCRSCGTVDVPVEAYTAGALLGSREGFYRFTCPDCGMVACRQSRGRILTALALMGVDVNEVRELPLTMDEIEAFARQADPSAILIEDEGEPRTRFNAIRAPGLRINRYAEEDQASS